MQRLIQGDVGAGKTMVAWFSSLRVIENGFQAVWMAPTELLAEQHFRNLQPYAEKLAIKARLMTGSLTAKERKAALDEISKGGIQVDRRYPRADSGRRARTGHGPGCHRRTASFRGGAATGSCST